jgi:acetyltransferase
MAPYPAEWERHLRLPDGRAVDVRPIRPDDEALYGPFLAATTAEDLRLRFFGPIKEFTHKFLSRFTHVDYDSAMAFIALDAATGEMLGVARLHANPDRASGEYAILVRSDLKGHGLGWRLMAMVIAFAREKDFRAIQGQVLRENTTMLSMCAQLGFKIESDPAARDICNVSLVLKG